MSLSVIHLHDVHHRQRRGGAGGGFGPGVGAFANRGGVGGTGVGDTMTGSQMSHHHHPSHHHAHRHHSQHLQIFPRHHGQQQQHDESQHQHFQQTLSQEEDRGRGSRSNEPMSQNLTPLNAGLNLNPGASPTLISAANTSSLDSSAMAMSIPQLPGDLTEVSQQSHKPSQYSTMSPTTTKQQTRGAGAGYDGNYSFPASSSSEPTPTTHPQLTSIPQLSSSTGPATTTMGRVAPLETNLEYFEHGESDEFHPYHDPLSVHDFEDSSDFSSLPPLEMPGFPGFRAAASSSLDNKGSGLPKTSSTQHQQHHQIMPQITEDDSGEHELDTSHQ